MYSPFACVFFHVNTPHHTHTIAYKNDTHALVEVSAMFASYPGKADNANRWALAAGARRHPRGVSEGPCAAGRHMVPRGRQLGVPGVKKNVISCSAAVYRPLPKVRTVAVQR